MNLSAIGAAAASFRTQPVSQPNPSAPAQRGLHGHNRRAEGVLQAVSTTSPFTQSQTTASVGALLDTLV